MPMMDSIKKGIRRMAMSAAILTAPFAQANTAESQPEEAERATVTLTQSSQDLFAKYQSMLQAESDRGFSENLSPELTSFLLKNHTAIKDKLLSDFNREDAYNNAHPFEVTWDRHGQLKTQLNDFQKSMTALYGALKQKANLGAATDLEQELLESLKSDYAPAAQDSIQLAKQFSQLLNNAGTDNQAGRDNLASFLVEHYSGLKKIESDSAGTPICQQFLLDRQQLYQTLRQKVEDGTADSVDQLTLSAISVKDQGKLNQFLSGISYDSVRDQNVNPTIYRAMTGLVDQMNDYMDVFKIHPDSRLTLAQTLFQNFAGFSEKKGSMTFGDGIEVNTAKLAEFLEKTGTTIETEDGIRFVLNNPDSRTKEGFEISLKKSDMMQSMRCISQAYQLLCNENAGLNQDVNMIFQDVVQNPGIGTLRSLPNAISNLIEDNQDLISPEVREQVGQYLTQAAQIPFAVNFHDANGSRPATKADAGKCVDIVLDTVYALDDAGVIDISAIAKQNKGSSLIGLMAKAKWVAKLALKSDITKGFHSFLDQRDEALVFAKNHQNKSDNMLARIKNSSNPMPTDAIVSAADISPKGTSPSGNLDTSAIVASIGGRG